MHVDSVLCATSASVSDTDVPLSERELVPPFPPAFAGDPCANDPEYRLLTNGRTTAWCYRPTVPNVHVPYALQPPHSIAEWEALHRAAPQPTERGARPRGLSTDAVVRELDAYFARARGGAQTPRRASR